MKVTFVLLANIVGLSNTAGRHREKAPMFKLPTLRADDAVGTQSRNPTMARPRSS